MNASSSVLLADACLAGPPWVVLSTVEYPGNLSSSFTVGSACLVPRETSFTVEYVGSATSSHEPVCLAPGDGLPATPSVSTCSTVAGSALLTLGNALPTVA